MSTYFKGFALLAILVSSIGVVPIFASPALLNDAGANSTSDTSGNTNSFPSSGQSGAITVTTDKPSYNDGDKITISGSTQEYISGTPITLQVISPIGNRVQFAQIDLGSDRTFSTTITGSGPLWKEAGAYQVIVQFGSKDRSAETTFQFSGSNGGGQGNTMKVDGTDLSVTYSITNGKVLGIKADVQSKSLIVSITTTGDGVLTITLPRGLIDAQVNGQDDHFYVLNDGQEADFQETSKTTTDRTLSIPFTDGTEEIEIIGTQIIPEFGPIAALVLAIAIISIIAVSAKTGLRFIPKY
ncbi:MAG TPA: PEFG-CTERM sorting domain-containing protein [Candidatus Nitrosotalea sp.]|nr:PEFG-CTERM sorting domain-containing protein [Candidatus Nitrosotalea sp.]